MIGQTKKKKEMVSETNRDEIFRRRMECYVPFVEQDNSTHLQVVPKKREKERKKQTKMKTKHHHH
jgi:hypothetical protein